MEFMARNILHFISSRPVVGGRQSSGLGVLTGTTVRRTTFIFAT